MREKGLRRFDYYAKTQRWIWRKVRELQDRYDLDEGIDVIADALTLYEEHLKERAREADAQA